MGKRNPQSIAVASLDVLPDGLFFALLEQTADAFCHKIEEAGSSMVKDWVAVVSLCDRCDSLHPGMLVFPEGLPDTPDERCHCLRLAGSEVSANGLTPVAMFFCRDFLQYATIHGRSLDRRTHYAALTIERSGQGRSVTHTDLTAAPIPARVHSLHLGYFFRGALDDYLRRSAPPDTASRFLADWSS